MNINLDFWSNNFPATLLWVRVYERKSRQKDTKLFIYHSCFQPSNTGSVHFLVFHQHYVVKVRSQE